MNEINCVDRTIRNNIITWNNKSEDRRENLMPRCWHVNVIPVQFFFSTLFMDEITRHAPDSVEMSNSVIVQYVILRKDLMKVFKWSVGAVIAQACHATVAVTHLFHDDPHMKEYLSNLDSMHKVILEIPDENSIRSLESCLIANGIKHKVWIEKPENIPTCIVVKPYPKEEVKQYFQTLKLFKEN